MLLLKPFTEDHGRSAVQLPFYFHCAPWFATTILAHMLDSLVRVSRRDKENHFVIATSTCVTTTVQNTLKSKRYNTQKGHILKDHIGHSKPAMTHATAQRPNHKWFRKYTAASALVSFAYISAISGTL